MCLNESCPSRERCYRYMATPSEFMQAYAAFVFPPGSTSCDDFLDLREWKPLRTEKTKWPR